jgi:hypothetical protein
MVFDGLSWSRDVGNREEAVRNEENSVATGLSARGAGQTLALAWDRLLETLPEDWSHLLVEVELQADEPYDRVALIASALNPERCGKRSAFRFRVAHDFGYGAAPEMARRCLDLLDGARIAGRLRVLRLLEETRAVATQGPVWRIEGRSL